MSNQYDEPLDMDEREPDSFTREELLNAIQNYDAQRQVQHTSPSSIRETHEPDGPDGPNADYQFSSDLMSHQRHNSSLGALLSFV